MGLPSHKETQRSSFKNREGPKGPCQESFIWLSDKYATILTLLAPEAPIKRGLSILDGGRGKASEQVAPGVIS